jgi:anti-sigma factor RsiW
VVEEHIPYEQLIGYAAGELDERESAVVVAHLPGCAVCAKTVARFKTVREILHNDDTVEPPPPIVVRAQAIFGHIPYAQLIGYAARDLNERESAVVATHLARCAECAATVAHFRSVRQLVRGDFSTDPPPATVTRAQAIFRQHHPEPQPSRTALGWLEFLFPKVRPLVAASVAVVLLACLLVLGQMGGSSSDVAIPGDALYAIKLNAENAQVALTPDQVRKAQVLLDLTEKRVGEMVALDANGRDDYIPETATRYEDLTDRVKVIVGQLAQARDSRTPGLGAVADTVLSRNIGVLTSLLDKVTEQVRSALAHAISVSQNNRSVILNSVVTMQYTPTPTSGQAPEVVSTPTLPKLPAGQTLAPTGRTLVPAGQTPIPAGQTPAQPSQPSQPPVLPAPTNAQPLATPLPPSPTKVPPSATPVPPSPTKVPPSATSASPSPTNVPPGQTKTPPGQQTKIARTPTPAP